MLWSDVCFSLLILLCLLLIVVVSLISGDEDDNAKARMTEEDQPIPVSESPINVFFGHFFMWFSVFIIFFTSGGSYFLMFIQNHGFSIKSIFYVTESLVQICCKDKVNENKC